MRYLITFSYDGSKYSGYQKQPNKNTVQSELEDALFKINSNKIVHISASGRTDALVHALNQKAHFDLDKNIDCDKLKNSLNDLLSDNIYIKKVENVSENFHSRFDVKLKEYIYIINTGEFNPIEKDYVLQYNNKLDIEKMKLAANILVGTHDYSSFVHIEDANKDCVRTIKECNITYENDKIIISFIGTGFLRYMVRNMVGLLIEVGSGKKNVEDTKIVLDSKDRTKAGICAKACGLYLKDVYY